MSILDTIAKHSDDTYNSSGTERYDASQKMCHSPEYRREYHLYHYQTCIRRSRRFRRRHAGELSRKHHKYYLKHRAHILAVTEHDQRVRYYNHKY